MRSIGNIKFQITNIKTLNKHVLNIEICDLFGIWDFGFGASGAVHR